MKPEVAAATMGAIAGATGVWAFQANPNANPNGSPDGVTALTTPDDWGEEGPWMQIFRNARAQFR